MPEKLFPTIADRSFKCGGCPKTIMPGDPIIFMLPSKRRYCEPCGNRVYSSQVGAPEAGPVTTRSICQCADLEKRLAALESKPESPPADDVRYVDFKTYADKQTSIWRELETLNQKLTRLENRVDSLE